LYWEKHCYAEPAHPRDLDLLLKESADRVVAKDGISYRSRLYWHAVLPDLVGKHVEVRGKPIYRAPDQIEVFLDHQWMCTATATDLQTITQKDIGTAKQQQKEHLRRNIKRAREAADLADQEIAALQRAQSTQSVSSPDVTVSPLPELPSDAPLPSEGSPFSRSRPSQPSAPATKPQGDFLERMAAREQAQRKQEQV
jgi:hypothetical protein